MQGKPYAGNPHVRFDEGEVAPATTPRRGSLLYKIKLGRNASAKFSAPIEGVNISFGAEANGDVEMDVEYKD